MHFRNILRRSAFALFICSTVIACSDTTIGSKSFEETETFNVPGGLFVGLPLTLPLSFPIDVTEQEGYNDDSLNFVTSVRVRDIVFEVVPESNDTGSDEFEDGNPDSFEFVSSLDLSLRATVNGTEMTVPIADLPMSDPQIASNTTTLVMNVNDEQDIRDLIEAPGGAQLLVNVSGTVPPDFVLVDAKIRFRVGIGFR